MLHLVQQLVPFPLILWSNRMAWLWPGRGTVEPQWSNCSDAFLAIQNWTGQLGVANRICKDAFDWQPKGRAGDRPGLNSAGRPDVNGLAIQTQMVQPPRHQCQDLPPSPAVMSKPLQHHCRQELFRSHKVSGTWASQARPRHSPEVSRLSESSPPPLKPSGREGKAKFSAQGT